MVRLAIAFMLAVFAATVEAAAGQEIDMVWISSQPSVPGESMRTTITMQKQ